MTEGMFDYLEQALTEGFIDKFVWMMEEIHLFPTLTFKDFEGVL